MKRYGAIVVFLALVVAVTAMPVLAVTPVDPDDPDLVMYADEYVEGDEVTVQLPAANVARLNPANALGAFDAVQAPGVDANEKFFSLAARTFTKYTFESDFMNVTGASDIKFAEVTWGNSWHPEATLVYLTGARVRNEDGEIVPYEGDDGGYGYYAGVAWNKVGIQQVTESDRDAIVQLYLPEGLSRFFPPNTLTQDGNFLITEFHLPDEVVCAEGITLVDITWDVYDLAGPSRAGTYSGNTDGYDLDAIRVYRCVAGGDDSATGMGIAILEKGTWFMYNAYPKGPYEIQAGNPKDGSNIIGTYDVTVNGDDTYTVNYEMDFSIVRGGYEWEIIVVDEHLGIADFPDLPFTAKPGQDDNQDFGAPFSDGDGAFFIFAHFAVEYR